MEGSSLCSSTQELGQSIHRYTPREEDMTRGKQDGTRVLWRET